MEQNVSKELNSFQIIFSFFQYNSLHVSLKSNNVKKKGKKFAAIFILKTDLKVIAKLLPKFQWN